MAAHTGRPWQGWAPQPAHRAPPGTCRPSPQRVDRGTGEPTPGPRSLAGGCAHPSPPHRHPFHPLTAAPLRGVCRGAVSWCLCPNRTNTSRQTTRLQRGPGPRQAGRSAGGSWLQGPRYVTTSSPPLCGDETASSVGSVTERDPAAATLSAQGPTLSTAGDVSHTPLRTARPPTPRLLPSPHPTAAPQPLGEGGNPCWAQAPCCCGCAAPASGQGSADRPARPRPRTSLPRAAGPPLPASLHRPRGRVCVREPVRAEPRPAVASASPSVLGGCGLRPLAGGRDVLVGDVAS